jgi:uncharacterized membrane protein YdbT with pleckstrin-like domain
MTTIPESLMPNEQLLADTDLHWIIFFWPVLLTGFLTYFMFKQHVMFMLNYLAIALIIYTLSSTFIRYISTRYLLTSARAIKRTGFVSSQTWEIRVNRIESVQLSQTMMGKMIGYGNLTIMGMGGDQILFTMIDEPLSFQQKIFQAMEQSKA